MKKIQDFVKSERFSWLIKGALAVILLLVVFQLGVFVGAHKAEFSYNWSHNYHQMFGGPRGGFFRNFDGRDFIGGHGAAGQIANIQDNQVIIKGRDGIEKSILVGTDTAINKMGQSLKITDLKINDNVVVIGEPTTNGSVEARIIRVFDSPPQATSPSPVTTPTN